MSDENGNEFIRGIETRACVNGMTKSDVEKLKDALVKKILDDETVIEITENGKVIADSDGMIIQMNGLEVEGYNQLTSGKVKLLPMSTGAKVEFTDSDQRSISLIHGRDGDKSFLRIYPNTYYPVDSNENPVAPNSDVLMTSGLVGVDPRIVHTTGNEEIGGQKTFTESLKTSGNNGTMTIDDTGRITYHQSNPDSTAMAGLEYDEEQEQTYMYAPSYLPVDSDENPQVPYDDIVLTSMNLAVDPRIVHTTGNETVAGNKSFSGNILATGLYLYNNNIPSVDKWVRLYTITPHQYSGNTSFIVRPRTAVSLPTEFLLYISGNADNVQFNIRYNDFQVQCVAAVRSSDNVVEIWGKKAWSDWQIDYRYRHAIMIGDNTQSDNPPVIGDVYSKVITMGV